MTVTAGDAGPATERKVDAMPRDDGRSASLYRMVMEDHLCPYGLKAKDLPEREGFVVEDHWLESREQTDAFMAEQCVDTTPQIFIEGERHGRLRRSARTSRQGCA